MTSPTLESTTTTSITSSTTSHSHDLPATVAAGDLLIAVVVFGHSTVTPGSSLSGWTQLFNREVIAFHRWMLYIKRADGTEGGTTIDFTTGSAVKGGGNILRVSGAWGSGGEGTAFDLSSVTSTGFGTGPNPSVAAASWGSADQLYVAGATAGGTGATYTAPSGYSSLAQVSTSAGHTVGTAVLAETSASDDPGPFTLDDSENHQAFTLVIRPQAVAGDTEITSTTTATAYTEVTGAGGTTITSSTTATAVVGSVGTGDTEITSSTSITASLSMTGDTEITSTTTATGFTRNRGAVLVTQGEQAILGGTWGAATASSCRLFVDDPSAALTDAGRNALTEDDFTEPSFTGYAAQALTSGNWTVTAGEPSDMTHAEVTFTCSSGPGSPEEVDGYYVTRDSDGALIYFDVFVDGPSTISETNDNIAFQPKLEIPV